MTASRQQGVVNRWVEVEVPPTAMCCEVPAGLLA